MLSLLSTAMTAGDELQREIAPQDLEFFEKSVRPLLVRHCYGCHSSAAKKIKGDLRLDTREGWLQGGESGPAVSPGDPENSLLIRAVRYADEELQMPPKEKLSDAEIAVLVRWIERGAPDPRSEDASGESASRRPTSGRDFWAFQKPQAAQPPPVEDGDWPLDPVDRFILARLEAQGLAPVGDASRPAWLRRVTFDLTGLPPTAGEIRDFVQDDAPGAHERVVDRLLRSRHFGERWGRHWLDVARYGESTGRTRNYPFPFAWRYRDYVIEAFNEDKPYDEFLREQIAGDLLKSEDDEERKEHLVATGFLALGPKDLNERNREKFLMDQVDEQIDVMSQSMLGLTISCARCHDHKFDPIPTTDYYALAGFFRSTETLHGYASRRGGKNQQNDSLLVKLEETAEPRGKGPSETRSSGPAAREIAAELRTERRKLAGLRKRLEETTGAERRRLARRMKQLRQSVAELAEKLENRGEEKESAEAYDGELAMGVRDRARAVDCRVHIQGEHTNLGEEVERRFPQVLTSAVGTKLDRSRLRGSSGRLQLAEWIASAENPLTARVFVNRVWHHLFGNGIVRTVDNFGATGERPSHPELLDWLAVRFVEDGWSVKQLVRRLVLSRTYRLATDRSEAQQEVDPDNRLRWRQEARRLEAECIFDALLAISGELDRTPPEASPVSDLKANEIRRGFDPRQMYRGWKHRSVYMPVVRGYVPEFFEVFDFPDPDLVKGSRDVTTVSTQALFLMNDPFVIEQSRKAARQLVRAATSDRERLELAYLETVGRKPSDDELERALKYLNGFAAVEGGDASDARKPPQEAWAQLVQALFACAEFRYLD